MLKYKLLYFSFLCGSVYLFSGCKPNKNEDFRVRMLNAVNLLRSTGCVCGEDTLLPVHPLVWDESLEVAAKRHVNDMAINGFLGSIGSDASIPQQRASEAGFTGSVVTELSARGFVSVEDVMEKWKNTPQYCRTMMSVYYYYFGAAYQDFYWLQVYGTK